jgi:hypothetical protein
MKGHLQEKVEMNTKAKIVAFADLPNIPINLVESGLSRVQSKMKRSNVGAISAFRNENTWAENMTLHRKLRAKLISLGYDVTEVVGAYIENKGTKTEKEVQEVSLFVACKPETDCDKLEYHLRQLGLFFNQDSILYKPADSTAYLVGTSKKGTWLGYGETQDQGMPAMGRLGEFMSRVRNRPFIFDKDKKATVNEFVVESVTDIDKPSTRNGLWSMRTDADSVILESI